MNNPDAPQGQLPARLIADLANRIPASSVSVLYEATISSPWVISLDRDIWPQARGPYATVRPEKILFFDTFDDALVDAGDVDARLGADSYYEAIPATEPPTDIGFKPPVTFVGLLKDILFLSIPLNVLRDQAQARELRAVIKMTLSEAVAAKKIPTTDLRVVALPEGVRLFRIVERLPAKESSARGAK